MWCADRDEQGLLSEPCEVTGHGSACLPVLTLEKRARREFQRLLVTKVRSVNIEIEICYNEENLKDKNAICIVTMY